MNFFVFYSTCKYEPFDLKRFETEGEVLAFLNSKAGNSDFRFSVVLGREMTYKPVEVATKYQLALWEPT